MFVSQASNRMGSTRWLFLDTHHCGQFITMFIKQAVKLTIKMRIFAASEVKRDLT
jgi:hypothetical protein